MVSVERLVEGTKFTRTRYLELLNEQLSERVKFLEEMLREEKKEKRALMFRLEEKKKINMDELEPLGGFIPLRQRIKNAEEASRQELARLQKEQEDATE